MNKRLIIIISSALILTVAGIAIAVSGTFDTGERQIKLAYKLLNEGKYQEAIIVFEKIIEIEPRSTRAYSGLGLAHAHTGDYNKAFDIINRALDLGLKNPELLHEAMVNIFLIQGDESGVRQYIQSITEQRIRDYLGKKFPELFADKTDKGSRRTAAFTDPCFEKAIRVMLDKPKGDIFSEELAGIIGISIQGREVYRYYPPNDKVLFDDVDYGTEDGVPVGGIQSIEDLRWFTGLEHLVLVYNPISDISVLSELPKLRLVYLDGKQINDIGVLADMTNVTGLGLDGYQTEDIGFVSVLVNLTNLTLRRSNINDISAVAGLTALKTLNLSDNKISEIKAFSALTELTNLDLSNNQVSDIKAIASLTNLSYLRLANNQISDISALSGLTALTLLDLKDNQIKSINALSGLVNLELLYMINNQIIDYTPVLNLPSLNDEIRQYLKSLQVR